MPAFCQHLSYRFVGMRFPIPGLRAMIGGWCFRADYSITYPYMALLDSWAPALFPTLKAPQEPPLLIFRTTSYVHLKANDPSLALSLQGEAISLMRAMLKRKMALGC